MIWIIWCYHSIHDCSIINNSNIATLAGFIMFNKYIFWGNDEGRSTIGITAAWQSCFWLKEACYESGKYFSCNLHRRLFLLSRSWIFRIRRSNEYLHVFERYTYSPVTWPSIKQSSCAIQCWCRMKYDDSNKAGLMKILATEPLVA